MSKAIYQKMYTDKYERDMDFVIIGDFYIGPFVDRASAEKSADNINGNDFFCYKTPTRTKVEYEKVKDKHSITIEQFEYDGVNFYFRHPDCGQYVEMNRFTLYEKLRDNKQIYRRIETPITEREEFIEKVGSILPEFDKRTNPMWAGKLYDAGCRFVGE